jgi:hypothetical protein
MRLHDPIIVVPPILAHRNLQSAARFELALENLRRIRVSRIEMFVYVTSTARIKRILASKEGARPRFK